MSRVRTLVGGVALVAALLGWWAGAGEPASVVMPPGALGELLKRVPAQDAASAAELSKELVKTGPEGVKQLVALLVEPGKTDDSKVRFALHGMAIYVARSGAEDERKGFVEAVNGALTDGKLLPLVNAFLIQQLRLCAAKESVPALGRFLLDEKLCEDATQALLSIKGEEAATALREALPQAKGGCRLTIIQALGILRDAKAAPEIAKAVTDENREVRLAAAFALGNIGDASATEALTKAASVEPAYERSQATDALLTFAQRLIEADKKADAEKIYRQLWTTRAAAEDRHTRCAALRGLAAALGSKAMDDLTAAMKSDDLQIRSVAAEAATALPGEDVTRMWVERLKDAAPAVTVEILNILARRGDRAALPAAIEALKDADAKVRQAAILAVGAIGKKDALPALLGVLAGKEDADRPTARNALMRIPGDETTVALAAALPTAPKEVRAALLGVLAGRGAQAQLDAILACMKDEDEGVRVAALDAVGFLGDEKPLPKITDVLVKTKSAREREAAERAAELIARRVKDKAADILLAALPNAELDPRCALLRILGSTGSAKTLEPLRGALKDAEAKVQEAGIRALSKWPDATVASDLLDVAKGTANKTHRTLAFRYYLDLLRLPSKRSAEDSLKLYEDAMKVAASNEEKKSILGPVGDVKTIGSLKLVAPCLDVEALRPEAEAAVLRLADHLRDAREPEARQEMRDALAKVIENAKDARVAKDARSRLDRFKK